MASVDSNVVVRQIIVDVVYCNIDVGLWGE